MSSARAQLRVECSVEFVVRLGALASFSEGSEIPTADEPSLTAGLVPCVRRSNIAETYPTTQVLDLVFAFVAGV